MSNLAFRSVTTGSDQTFTVSSINAGLPTGTVAGDLQAIWFLSVTTGASPTHTTPAGWTLGGTNTWTGLEATYNVRISLFYKIAGGSEGSVTLNASGNCAIGFIRQSYDNPDISQPFGQVVWGNDTDPSAAGSGVNLSLTTSRDAALLAAYIYQPSVDTWTNSASFTERYDGATGLGMAADLIQAAAGASGNKNFVSTSAADCVWGLAEYRSEVTGTLTATLAAATLASTGTVAIKGTTTSTLSAATLSAAGTIALTGVLSKTLADVSLAGTGTLAITGALAKTLDDATLVATGVLMTSGSGTLDATLAALTSSATGTVALSGVLSQTLGAATLASTGVLGLAGVLSATLGDATLVATGVVVATGTGALNATLGALTLVADGDLALAGVLETTLDACTLVATGLNDAPVTQVAGGHYWPTPKKGSRKRKERPAEGQSLRDQLLAVLHPTAAAEPDPPERPIPAPPAAPTPPSPAPAVEDTVTPLRERAARATRELVALEADLERRAAAALARREAARELSATARHQALALAEDLINELLEEIEGEA